MTTWVVQENLAGEAAYDEFIATIRETGAPLEIVKVIPFSHELIPEPPDTFNIAFGGLTLESIARDRNWTPGTFTNNNHHFQRWSQGYRGYLLNDDAEIAPFGQAKFDGVRFIRPLDDSKVFAGQVIEGSFFDVWKEQVADIQDSFSTLTENTPILMAYPKRIDEEYRFFVVDSRVVTGSMYKEYGRTRKERVDILRPHPAAAFASSMVRHWKPCRNFVLDVCKLPTGEFKVVEINSLTSAGFYDCDTRVLVHAIQDIL